MAHPLEKKVASVRRAIRGLTLVRGLAWGIVSVLGAVLLLGTADYLIHFQDPGIRLICSLLTLALAAWTLYRYLVVPGIRRLADVDVAQRVERCFPQLNDRLASSITFLKQSEDDREAGSAALRRAVITDAEVELEDLDLRAVVDRRPAKRATAWAAAFCLVVALLALVDASSVRIAMVRLAQPLGDTHWPRANYLVLKSSPKRIAAGQTFEVELYDRNGHLPDEVRIHYRYDRRNPSTDETELMQLYDSEAGAVMLARKERVTRPFEYRAEGGDDDSMDWISLEVVEPPRVESFSVMLYPPEYTGWSPAESDKQIRALHGTHAQINATATKPLQSARLRREDGEEIAADISEDEHGFSIPTGRMTIDKSGAYWFVLEDNEQLIGGTDERWDIRAVPDTPPSVTIEQPASNIFVTQEAVVPIRVLVKDNLAIRDVVLIYTRSDHSDEGELVIPLFTGREQVAPAPGVTLATGTDLGESHVVEHDWRLADLRLALGTQILLHARASDYRPQTGQTPVARQITIITEAELEHRIADRQASILNELGRALRIERDVRSQTTALVIQAEEVGSLGRRDLDNLQAAEFNQREVAQSLTGEQQGVVAQIDRLLADLVSNRVDSPDIEQRMQGLLSEIDRLAKNHLPAIRRELTTALKTTQAGLRDSMADETSAAVKASLSKATSHEDEVIASLEQLLGELSQWAGYRRFAREIGQIRQIQEELERATRQLGLETLTKDLKDLSPQQHANLKKLTERQGELARHFDKLQQQMREMGDQLRTSEPLAAETLADALDQARRSAISSQMREAARQVEGNQVGQAAMQQKSIIDNLKEMLDTLSNRREHELGRLVKKLREAERDLQELRAGQRGLRKKIEEVKQLSDPEERRRRLQRLSRSQKKLQQEADRMARRLQRLQADRAGRSAERGASNMGQSAEAGSQGDARQAGDASRQAQKDLDEAQKQLAQARRKAEADLAQEQLARFEDNVRGMIDQQQSALDETVRLETIRTEQQRLTRAQARSVGNLARQQQLLKDEVEGFAGKMAGAEVFQLALDATAREMGRAAGLLKKRHTDETTQQAERRALARLNHLLQALAKDNDEEKDGKPEKGGGAGGQGGGGGGAQKIHDVSELKLLKLMQQDVNSRTRALEDQLARAKTLTDQQRREYQQLSEEQGQLADIVLNLLESEDSADEDNPESLPDMRDDLEADDDLPRLDLEGLN